MRTGSENGRVDVFPHFMRNDESYRSVLILFVFNDEKDGLIDHDATAGAKSAEDKLIDHDACLVQA